MDTLTIAINHGIYQFELLSKKCPHTVKTLKTHLPFRTELHYAKIAGEEIMAVMPFNSPIENALEVSKAKAGMLVFWPERHLLCLYYGKMQEEAASISLLGYLKGDSVQFSNAGERIRREQGKILNYGTFYIKPPEEAVPIIIPKYSLLHPFEKEIWKGIPDEILQMTIKTGIMRPAGPLLYAEADTHAFHEYLASSIRILPKADSVLAKYSNIFCSHLNAFHNKMAGWYLIPETASVIKIYLKQLSRTDDAVIYKSLLENLMLFVGRLNYWFDALIPWDEFNEYMKSNTLHARKK